MNFGMYNHSKFFVLGVAFKSINNPFLATSSMKALDDFWGSVSSPYVITLSGKTDKKKLLRLPGPSPSEAL